MALTQNSLCDWDDIVTLFTNLNTERTRFNYSKLTIPSNTGVAMSPSVITTLRKGISDLQNNTFVGTTANVRSVVIPSSGSLVKSQPITTMNTIVNNIRNVRTYSSNFSSFRGNSFTFGTFFSGDYNNDFSGNFCFTPSFSSNFSGNFNSDFSGDYMSNDDYVSSIKSGGNF